MHQVHTYLRYLVFAAFVLSAFAALASWVVRTQRVPPLGRLGRALAASFNRCESWTSTVGRRRGRKEKRLEFLLPFTQRRLVGPDLMEAPAALCGLLRRHAEDDFQMPFQETLLCCIERCATGKQKNS